MSRGERPQASARAPEAAFALNQREVASSSATTISGIAVRAERKFSPASA